MSPREEESPSQVDYTQRDAVETFLISQVPCDDDSHCMRPSDLAELRKLDGNDVCIDCGETNPDWASISLGVFMCLGCSGQHRALGTHVSKVRSVNMDSWSPEQLGLMKCGGNKQCVKFLKQHGLRRHHTVVERYDCAAAMWYQQILKARRDGTEEPKAMPDYTPTRRVVLGRDSIRGIGSSHNSNNSNSTHHSRGSFMLGTSFHGPWNLSPGALSPRLLSRRSSAQPDDKQQQQQQQKGGPDLLERGKLMEAAMVEGARTFIRKLSLVGASAHTPEHGNPTNAISTTGSSFDDDKKTSAESFSSDESPASNIEDEDDDICSVDEFGEEPSGPSIEEGDQEVEEEP